MKNEVIDNYKERAEIAEKKLEKLKALILLTDPAVSNIEMNDLTMKQWDEFTREFPDEK